MGKKAQNRRNVKAAKLAESKALAAKKSDAKGSEFSNSSTSANNIPNPDTLESALDIFACSHLIPQYSEFKFWVHKRLAVDKGVSVSASNIVVEMVKEYKKIDVYSKKVSESGRPSSKEEMAEFSKMNSKRKILESALSDLLRPDVLDTLINPPIDVELKDFTQLKNLDSARQRFTLFESLDDSSGERVVEKTIRAAFALGCLQEKDHDAGELDYLSGRIFANAKLWQSAIRCFNKIQKDNKDYVYSRFYYLRCVSFLGNSEMLLREYRDCAELLSSSEKHCLFQSFLMARPHSEKYIEEIAQISNLTSRPDNTDRGYEDYVSNSVELVIRIIEGLTKLANSIEMKTDADRASAESEICGVSIIQLLYAYEATLGAESSLGSLDSMAPIFQKLFDLCTPFLKEHRLVGSIAFHKAILSFYWHMNENQAQSNLETFWPSLETLSKMYPDSTRSLIYQYRALLSSYNSPSVARIDLLLKEIYQEEIEALIPIECLLNPKVAKILRGPSAAFYSSACEQIRRVWNEQDTMGDHGAISIGLFRIIEKEYKDKIVFPICESMSEESKKELIRLAVKLTRSRSLLENFESILQGNGKMVMLANIRQFIEILRRIINSNVHDSQYVKTTLSGVLTDAGLAALQSQLIEKSVEQSILNKFRNPPAHAEFLDFSTALECKKYVDGVLVNLHQWVRALPM